MRKTIAIIAILFSMLLPSVAISESKPTSSLKESKAAIYKEQQISLGNRILDGWEEQNTRIGNNVKFNGLGSRAYERESAQIELVRERTDALQEKLQDLEIKVLELYGGKLPEWWNENHITKLSASRQK